MPGYAFGQEASACVCAAAGTVSLTSSWQTLASAFFRLAGSPLAASSQIVASLALALADRVGAALMLDLHCATAAFTAGFDAMPDPPDAPLLLLAVLVLAGAALLVVDVAAGVELAAVLLLLLPPQPASTALPTAATASRELSVFVINPPQV
jgi:hypothetical protein